MGCDICGEHCVAELVLLAPQLRPSTVLDDGFADENRAGAKNLRVVKYWKDISLQESPGDASMNRFSPGHLPSIGAVPRTNPIGMDDTDILITADQRYL